MGNRIAIWLSLLSVVALFRSTTRDSSGGQPLFSDSLSLTDVGLSNLQGYVGAIGDFNSDTFADLFIVQPDVSAFDIYLWHKEAKEYQLMEGGHVASPNITQVVPGDFNYDGRLDVLVQGDAPSSSSSSGVESYIHIYMGDIDQVNTTTPWILPNATDAVLVLDATGDLALDLFGSAAPNGDRMFWINNLDGTFTLSPQADGSLSDLRSPSGNSFVDLNGDCRSDLVAASDNGLEIWINTEGGFASNTTYELAEGAGQISWGDVDGDGALDAIIPVCSPFPSCAADNSLYIVYNQQMSMCETSAVNPNAGSGDQTGCRDATNLCMEDPDWKFDVNGFAGTLRESTADVVRVDLDTVDSLIWFTGQEFSPLRVRLGDYNADSYPDGLLPLRNPSLPQQSFVHLFDNVPCTKDLCGAAATEAGRRTFTTQTKGTAALYSYDTVYAATFIDIGETGTLDILALWSNPEGGSEVPGPRVSGSSGIYTFQNNYFVDAYFMKTLGLNGVCHAWCDAPVQFPDPKPYGVSFPGASFKFTIADLAGVKHARQGASLPDSGYLSLHTPYVYYGLGRTNGYLEEFFFGLPLRSANHFGTRGAIVPNSQIIAIPYPPESPVDWQYELYINISEWFGWVFLAMISLLALNGLVVMYYYWKERREDDDEKERAAQDTMFSFDTL